MEHHHFDQCVMILNSDGNKILQDLSPEQYGTAVRLVESAILSTDLALYFKSVQRLILYTYMYSSTECYLQKKRPVCKFSPDQRL